MNTSPQYIQYIRRTIFRISIGALSDEFLVAATTTATAGEARST